VLVAPGAAQAAAEATVTVLPFTNPVDVVATGDRVFVSGGFGTSQVVVTDAAGAVTGTLDGLVDPFDLQLSHDGTVLYVAERGSRRIAAYDTGSLARSAVYDADDAECPTNLAVTERFVWFGYGCDQWGGSIGRIDLSQQPATVTLGLGGEDFYDSPLLATASANDDILFVGQPALSPWTGWSYAIGADGELTQTSRTDHTSVGSNLADAALDPTGSTVYTASGYPYYVQSFRTADLTKTGLTYITSNYPNSVELTRDGTRIAGGVSGTYNPDVIVFNLDRSVVASFELGGQDHLLADHGLAWHPDGDRVYAISNDGYLLRDPAQLHVLPVG
jgi:sugar lactone lactonase YvrE